MPEAVIPDKLVFPGFSIIVRDLSFSYAKDDNTTFVTMPKEVKQRSGVSTNSIPLSNNHANRDLHSLP